MLMVFGLQGAGAQTSDRLTLDECRRLARENYPAVKQYALTEQSSEFTLSNIAKGWLPRISVQATGAAFTDILKDNPQMQAMGVSMDNYVAGASVTVRQNVYDGGQTAAEKRMAEAQTDVKSKQLDVAMYEVNGRVDQLFFSILLIDEQSQMNRLLQTDLETAEQTVRSMMKGGVANQGDLETLEVERLKLQQQQDVLQTSRKACLDMLGLFIGKSLSAQTQLQKPSDGKTTQACLRPELSYYTAQEQLLAAQKKRLDAKLMPTLSFFGTGMVHSQVTPLLNRALLMGGLTLSWNIGALYTRKNDLRQLSLQRSEIDAQRETFLFNNRLQQSNTDGNIASLRKQAEKDGEIVSLRENILRRSRKKVAAGTESVNEMVRNINAVNQARQQKALHEVQLLQEVYRLKNITNT